MNADSKLVCNKHNRSLECLAGRSAHRDNWYCPECAQERNAKPVTAPASSSTLHFVFDVIPGPDGARLIEVETPDGKSVNAGEWRKRSDGLAELVVNFSTSPSAAVVPEVKQQADDYLDALDVLFRWSKGNDDPIYKLFQGFVNRVVPAS